MSTRISMQDPALVSGRGFLMESDDTMLTGNHNTA